MNFKHINTGTLSLYSDDNAIRYWRFKMYRRSTLKLLCVTCNVENPGVLYVAIRSFSSDIWTRPITPPDFLTERLTIGMRTVDQNVLQIGQNYYFTFLTWFEIIQDYNVIKNIYLKINAKLLIVFTHTLLYAIYTVI